MSQLLTTGDVARLTGWTIAKTRALCESGRLPAIDTSTGDRPRWNVRPEDLQAFLTPRSGGTKTKAAPTTRRRRLDADVAKVF